jgi:hypothetical protein
MRNPRISELTDGPFDEFFHTADVRRYRGSTGRYNITKLAFYLYRLRAYKAINVTPFSLGDGLCYSFDPSGRDIPLFSKSSASPDWNEWHSAAEADLAAPIPCRLLGHATYLVSEAIILQLMNLPSTPLSSAAADELRKIAGLVFKNESSLLNIILTFSNSAEILAPGILLPLFSLSLMADCGKSRLLPDEQTVLSNPLDENSIVVGFEAPSEVVFTNEKIISANLMSWPFSISRELAIDAENGRFMFKNIPSGGQKIYIAYHYGLSGPVGAGTYERSRVIDSVPDITKSGGGALISADMLNDGVTQIDDSKTYGPVASKVAIVDMTLQSANQQRPYMCLESNWVLNTGANKNSNLTLDGLWIGAKGDFAAEIILRGDYECVVIRNCTLDPGGSINIKNEVLHPVKLIIEGRVENLCIESSIIGPVLLRSNGYVEEASFSDSIVQSVDPLVNAIEIITGKTNIERSTVFGQVGLHRLNASEALITGITSVTDTQNGCFRFSAAPQMSRLPHPFESFLFIKDSNHWFTSRRFGDPGYAQLSDTAPGALKEGGENKTEMGAFSTLLNPVKFNGLKTKIDEYMPFGLIPIYINKT